MYNGTTYTTYNFKRHICMGRGRRKNFDILTGSPLPIIQYTTTGDLPTASSYDECLAMVGDVLYISDGTSWAIYCGQAAYVADSMATTVAQMATDFNLLLAALRAANIMAAS